jgi:c-di-AMP phosphodiesterase-like protein
MVKKARVSIGKRKLLVSLVFVSVIIIIIAFGCASTSALRRQNRSYNEALKQDTIEAYTEFIANNPDGVHVVDAKKRLVELEWGKTERTNTFEAYDSFIAKYKGYPSDSDYIGLAQKNLRKLNEQLALNESDTGYVANKGEKASKITLFKKSKSTKDGEAKAKLVSVDKSEYQKLSKTFITKLTYIFVRCWQRIFTFFEHIYSLIFNFHGDEIDGGRIVRVDK